MLDPYGGRQDVREGLEVPQEGGQARQGDETVEMHVEHRLEAGQAVGGERLDEQLPETFRWPQRYIWRTSVERRKASKHVSLQRVQAAAGGHVV